MEAIAAAATAAAAAAASSSSSGSSKQRQQQQQQQQRHGGGGGGSSSSSSNGSSDGDSPSPAILLPYLPKPRSLAARGGRWLRFSFDDANKKTNQYIKPVSKIRRHNTVFAHF